jgi:membrane protein
LRWSSRGDCLTHSIEGGADWQPRKSRLVLTDERSAGSSDPTLSPSIRLQTDAPAWTDSFWRVYRHISECRVLAVAAGVAFYALLAIFPALAALVSIYGLFADPMAMTSHLDALATLMPVGAIDVIANR